MPQLNLAKRIKDILNNFIQRLKETYADGLVSVILYGSTASSEFTEKYSNINLLVVLSDTSLGNLRKISRIITGYKFKMLKSLFFTEDYIKNSLDVFPIEFLDCKENYVVLYGKNVLENLKIDLRNLRFQCEQELKAKLINLKTIYLTNKDKGALKTILFKSLTSLVHILRNLIRLKGKTPSYQKEEVLQQINQEFQLDTSNFHKVLEAKKKNLKLSYQEIEILFFTLVGDLEKVVKIMDRHK